jgi:hypothetical protein
MYAIQENRYTTAWRSLGQNCQARAVLAIFAHWFVSVSAKPSVLHRAPSTILGFSKELAGSALSLCPVIRLWLGCGNYCRQSRWCWMTHGA